NWWTTRPLRPGLEGRLPRKAKEKRHWLRVIHGGRNRAPLPDTSGVPEGSGGEYSGDGRPTGASTGVKTQIRPEKKPGRFLTSGQTSDKGSHKTQYSRELLP